MTYFSETEFSVLILVHLLDHRLEAQMGLRCAQSLHRHLELGQVQVAIAAGVVPENRIIKIRNLATSLVCHRIILFEGFLVFLDLLTTEFRELCVEADASRPVLVRDSLARFEGLVTIQSAVQFGAKFAISRHWKRENVYIKLT